MSRVFIAAVIFVGVGCAAPATKPAPLSAYDLAIKNGLLHRDKKWHCLFSYNPNDCAMCIAGFGEAFHGLVSTLPSNAEVVLVLPAIRPAERNDALQRFPLDTLHCPVFFNDSIYRSINETVKPGSDFSSILIYDAQGKQQFAAVAHSTLDVPALKKMMR